MISVLLPVYNGEKFVEESIKSVLNQTFKDIELLIGFNGTVDDSKKIAESFKDSRIKIFDYQTEKGKPKTLNRLLKESKYDIIALQDDDDLWEHKKLELQLPLIKNYDVVGSQIIYIDEQGRSPTRIGSGPKLSTDSQSINDSMLNLQNNIANSSSLIKKQPLIDVEGWDESMPALEDIDLWIRMAKKGYKFTNSDKILVFHRIHDTSNFNAQTWDERELLKKHI
jgi:glycosyltransferase involved in cell wall biosynthesis